MTAEELTDILNGIKKDVVAYNGYHDFALENDIILSERAYLQKAAISTLEEEMSLDTFKAIAHYYFDIISMESHKEWAYRVEVMVIRERERVENLPPPRFVFVPDDVLPLKELAWMEERLQSWKYHDKLTDILSPSCGTKFNNWMGWR